jgi:hypothetical protein
LARQRGQGLKRVTLLVPANRIQEKRDKKLIKNNLKPPEKIGRFFYAPYCLYFATSKIVNDLA